MAAETPHPFESIESAQEFMTLLSSSIEDASRELQFDRDAAADTEHPPRRVEALDLALYQLKLLHSHVDKSRRILNDLRTVRRLLFNERSTSVTVQNSV